MRRQCTFLNQIQRSLSSSLCRRSSFFVHHHRNNQSTPTQKFCLLRRQKSPAWLHHHRTIITTTKPTGLFSIPELRHPPDFLKLADQAMTECNQLRNMIAARIPPQQNNNNNMMMVDAIPLLHVLDDISKAVCNVIDAAELCRNVHADPVWIETASQAFDNLSNYMTLLNSDTNLYRTLQLIHENYVHNNHSPQKLPEEEERFVILLKAEFERDGIHLPEQQREQVRDIHNELTQWESQFVRNIVQCGTTFPIQNYSRVYELFAPEGLNAYGIETTSTNDPLHMNTSNDSAILHTILKYSTSPNLRKEIYMAMNTSVPENIQALEHLRQLRHNMATIQGFPSFAVAKLMDKMAQHPDTVTTFLQKALRANTHTYRFEMCQLAAAKQRIEGNDNIEPWDISFYTAVLKSSEGEIQSNIAQYLTLSNTLEALQVLVKKLFGIEMKQENMAEEEKWDRDPNESTVPPDHIQIRKFCFTSQEGMPLGTMYMDLHPRKNKYGHAAHFTVRCGCALNYAESKTDNEDDNDDDDDDDDSHHDTVQYQLPIVTLVCSLSSTNFNGFMSHQEVETLLHEFGHGLHSLLSRTKFQHMAGTRGAMDFVETPSHLFENFAWDPDFLKILGSHYASGDPIPDDLIAALRKSRYEFAALERQNQLIYSLFDQKLFHLHNNQSAMEIFQGLHHEYDVPYTEGTHWFTRFVHLVTYGATYYSYQYAHVFANDIWRTCFEGKSLQRDAGEKLWHKMLIYGGTRDPNIMLHDILGRPPDFSTYYSS